MWFIEQNVICIKHDLFPDTEYIYSWMLVFSNWLEPLGVWKQETARKTVYYVHLKQYCMLILAQEIKGNSLYLNLTNLHNL